ncbi:MAG TPA: nitroreductase [Armatimonadota bacterium]|nr:nitroreductase [Armatimonadota bacterium]
MTAPPKTSKEYPRQSTGSADLQQALHFAIHAAVQAPSSHNSQPWLFRVHERSVDLLADRARGLPVTDPMDRELTISCGAALFHLYVAIRYAGFDACVQTLPEPGNVDLLARVEVGSRQNPSPDELLLFQAIPRRRTNRTAYEDRPLAPALLRFIEEEAVAEGSWLQVFESDSARDRLGDLIAAADRKQLSDVRFRREMASWLHPNRSRSRDGMPGYSMGWNELRSRTTPLLIRSFDIGRGRAASDRDLARFSPALAVLGTDEDTPGAWLAAGRALARTLLRAAASGLSASYLNQPIEVEEMRPAIKDLTGRDGYPQILLRLGYGGVALSTPRRDPESLILLPE